MQTPTIFTLFVRAVQAASELPRLVRDNAQKAKYVEEACFDESYIEFLDEQIELGARGAQWTAQLQKRRAALVPFCNSIRIHGVVELEGIAFTIQVDPQTNSVFHWEAHKLIWPNVT